MTHMTGSKKTVSERAAMARLRRKLKAAGENNAVGYDRYKQGYYLVNDGFLVERCTYTDFENWCREWGALAPYEALET